MKIKAFRLVFTIAIFTILSQNSYSLSESSISDFNGIWVQKFFDKTYPNFKSQLIVEIADSNRISVTQLFYENESTKPFLTLNTSGSFTASKSIENSDTFDFNITVKQKTLTPQLESKLLDTFGIRKCTKIGASTNVLVVPCGAYAALIGKNDWFQIFSLIGKTNLFMGERKPIATNPKLRPKYLGIVPLQRKGK